MPVNFDIVKRSYGRCVITRQSKEKFFQHFYTHFLNSDPTIRKMFERTVFEKQITMLKNAISMSILFAEKQDELAKDVLTGIRNSHSRRKLNVKPEYYSLWLNSLIDTLKNCDPQFNQQLEAEWRAMMQVSIDYIVAGY